MIEFETLTLAEIIKLFGETTESVGDDKPQFDDEWMGCMPDERW